MPNRKGRGRDRRQVLIPLAAKTVTLPFDRISTRHLVDSLGPLSSTTNRLVVVKVLSCRRIVARSGRAWRRLIISVALTLTIEGCATSSQLLTGSPRAPISTGDVRVYTQVPQSFEEIAVLSASRKSVSSAGGERAIEKMIESMKAQAARLGANGLLLEDFSDSDAVAVGSAVGSQTYTRNASINVGVGGSLGVIEKAAKGRAIFVASQR
jgi:hypothetical protein